MSQNFQGENIVRYCPKCGSVIKNDDGIKASYCSVCGARLDLPQRQPQQPIIVEKNKSNNGLLAVIIILLVILIIIGGLFLMNNTVTHTDTAPVVNNTGMGDLNIHTEGSNGESGFMPIQEYVEVVKDNITGGD
jgi:hypothetical protein